MSISTAEGTADARAIFASEAAFRAFYETALPRVYRYLLSRVGGDGSLAEELTQQTFSEAVRSRRRFDGRSDPVTWVIAIGRHRLVDHFRRLEREERRHRRLVREIDVSDASAWRGADERDAIERALLRLPAMQRAALVLRYMDDLDVRAVARTLDRSESAAESLLARARDAFRAAYEGGAS